jgi:hypothetical protein
MEVASAWIPSTDSTKWEAWMTALVWDEEKQCMRTEDIERLWKIQHAAMLLIELQMDHRGMAEEPCEVCEYIYDTHSADCPWQMILEALK